MRILSLRSVGWRSRQRTACPFPLQRLRWNSTTATANIAASQNELAALDAKWQERWKTTKPAGDEFRPSRNKTKYILPMFPYPSGTLHLGHLRVYTISDVLARFKDMQGYDVIHPIGWDAFGLPAENAAIERGISPNKWTMQNIDAMKTQMMAMGGRFDWDREIRTCGPEFYKHTQSIFLMLHERGLAYQAESLVNYDPVDKTVLANEQVDANGNSWRSGAKVEKKMLKQWFLKIKEFQGPLLRDLERLRGKWPENVLGMQSNWLGRSEGVKFQFNVELEGSQSNYGPIEVFTTRPDTVFGVQYIALAPNHPIVQHLAEEDNSLRAFLESAKELPQASKAGYLLPKVTATNPISKVIQGFNGYIPTYVAPYVLGDYGSGAVMGVPGHDTRDYEFWRANAGDAAIRRVITAPGSMGSAPEVALDIDAPYLGRGLVARDIPEFGGFPSKKAAREIVRRLQECGVQVEETENWRLRDWLISRQRYWGAPIPIIHCKSCGPVPVPSQDLPVELPPLPEEYFMGKTGNPLAEHPDWKKTACPSCGSAAERETDTMDTFMDSSWYFFRFLDPHNHETPFSPLSADKGMSVDVYIGGVEHAILHLLYARFISKFLATTPLWPKGRKVKGEPFEYLITQGMVHGKTYTDPETGRFLRPEELDFSNGPSSPIIVASGGTPKISYEKMSKSKYNGVDPGATIARYGADVTRAHMLFQAPVSDVLEWDETKITGVWRWLKRVLELSNSSFWMSPDVLQSFTPPKTIDTPLIELLRDLHRRRKLTAFNDRGEVVPVLNITRRELFAGLESSEQNLWAETQKTIASVTQSYSKTFSLNTIVSDLMTLTNLIWDTKHTSEATSHIRYYATAHLLRMLAPIAPAVAEEGWETIHKTTNEKINTDPAHPFSDHRRASIFAYGFPTSDTDIIAALTPMMTCVFQVEGKKKFTVKIRQVPTNTQALKSNNETTKWILDRVLETEDGKVWLEKGEGKIWKLSKTHLSDEQFEQIPNGWRVIIAKSGKVVNLVNPDRKKSAKASSNEISG